MSPTVEQVAWPFPARVWAPEAAPPTQVNLSGGDPPTITIARLHPLNGALRIIAMRDGNPAVVETITPVDIDVPDSIRRTGEVKLWRVTGDDGRLWIIAKGAGCGCGHPLKRVRVDRL